ncbi:MAG: hypothetical protein EOO62_36400 [Hymenobacter sp.]|nr:MAG: hypothetical protein EOO62_36400 [Hymenobacter sp.]
MLCAVARQETAEEIMEFWPSFFGKTVKIGDAFFGEMTFVEIVNDPAQSYWECQRYCRPSREVIELSVAGSLKGSGVAAAGFLRKKI